MKKCNLGLVKLTANSAVRPVYAYIKKHWDGTDAITQVNAEDDADALQKLIQSMVTAGWRCGAGFYLPATVKEIEAFEVRQRLLLGAENSKKFQIGLFESEAGVAPDALINSLGQSVDALAKLRHDAVNGRIAYAPDAASMSSLSAVRSAEAEFRSLGNLMPKTFRQCVGDYPFSETLKEHFSSFSFLRQASSFDGYDTRLCALSNSFPEHISDRVCVSFWNEMEVRPYQTLLTGIYLYGCHLKLVSDHYRACYLARNLAANSTDRSPSPD